jgi:hypothetical protein
MRRKTHNWPLVAVAFLGFACAFAVGGWVATKWVSPCVCIVGQYKAIQ